MSKFHLHMKSHLHQYAPLNTFMAPLNTQDTQEVQSLMKLPFLKCFGVFTQKQFQSCLSLQTPDQCTLLLIPLLVPCGIMGKGDEQEKCSLELWLTGSLVFNPYYFVLFLLSQLRQETLTHINSDQTVCYSKK